MNNRACSTSVCRDMATTTSCNLHTQAMTPLPILLFVFVNIVSASIAPNLVATLVGGYGVSRGGGGLRREEPTAPWHAGLYKKTKSYQQICGATIISKNVVVTAAHCFSLNRKLPSPSNYAVAAGKIHRLWNHTDDIGAQESDVLEIHRPPRYQGSIANFQDDLAVVILAKEFDFDEYVKPACVDFDPHFDTHQLKEGSLGMVVGWGLTGTNLEASEELQAATLPSIDIERCIDESPVSFRSSITAEKICAGYANGTALCRGDSGGGLVFTHEVDGEHFKYLRGVVSTSPPDDNPCNIYTWATFTHLLRHQHFIQKYVPDLETYCNGTVAMK